MNKKKLTIILSVLCAIALIVAIVLIASPKKNVDNPQENTPGTNIEDTTNPDEIQSSKDFVDGTRTDGEKELPILVDGENKGKAKAILLNEVFYVSLDDLKAANILNLSVSDGKMTFEKEGKSYVIEENKIVVTYNTSTNVDNTEEVTNEDSKGETSTSEFEISPTYIMNDNKYYLSEKTLSLLIGSYINNKAISVITGDKDAEITENFSKIENVLRNESLTDTEGDDLDKISEQLHNKSYTSKISSYGPISENVNGEEIKNILFNAFGNTKNIITSKKAENKYIVIFNSGVASSLMNVMLPSLSTSEVYANVRLLVETDNDGNITNIYGDSYYIFDGRDIYYYITLSAN